MMYTPGKAFFDVVRPLFGGRLTAAQVYGLQRIVDYAVKRGVSRAHLAYILATIFHETARWMEPIREGARRYGPNYSDAAARRAVAVIYAKGIISTNYALAHANGHSYYGRGLVQITWGDNYRKFGIYDDPDQALEWEVALRIAFEGMRDGLFTGKSLADVEEVGEQDYTNDRVVINGDGRKNGAKIGGYANTFYDALTGYEPRKEVSDGPIDPESAWPPRWWPFHAD